MRGSFHDPNRCFTCRHLNNLCLAGLIGMIVGLMGIGLIKVLSWFGLAFAISLYNNWSGGILLIATIVFGSIISLFLPPEEFDYVNDDAGQELPRDTNPEFIERVYYDLCVVCKGNTGVRTDTPVEQRAHYVEGCGQLCKKCHK